jgi:regulator of replication initiation timing
MIICPRCGTRLEDDFLYCDECGALLKTDGSDAENKEKLEGLNKQLAESADKNAEKGFEIERLKKNLKEKEENTSKYINQINDGKKTIEKIESQRKGVITGIIALVFFIVISIIYYANQERLIKNEFYNFRTQIYSLTTDNDSLQNELNSLQTQVNSLTSQNKSLQAEAEELRRLALELKINSISIGNTTKSGEIVDNYGATLYANRIRFLSIRTTCDSRITGNKTFYIKIINPSGTLRSGNNSPKGYSYDWNVYVSKGLNSLDLGGFGTESGGSYISGIYTVEVWYNNICLRSTSAILY